MQDLSSLVPSLVPTSQHAGNTTSDNSAAQTAPGSASQGVKESDIRRDDVALIQPYSGHATRQSLEIYSRLALADAQQRYNDVIGDFPV